MRFSVRVFVLVCLAALFVTAQKDWDEPFPPHRIAGNLYYVGSTGLSSYLVTTPQGHILINASFDRTVPLIRTSVEKLGYKFGDIKILLSSHAHGDHVAGSALVKELTGAKVEMMRPDDQVMEHGGAGQYLYKETWKPCKVDRVLKDGDTVSLGGTVLTAHLTPGHTRGCTTWTMKVEDGGKTYDVVIVGSPNVNPGYRLVHNAEYPEIAADFARTFQVLKSLHCDIFLGAHGEYYGMPEKYARLKSGAGGNPFVDPEGYRAYVKDREEAYLKTLHEQQ
ncbi:MAG: subclass B3 metallo-beta-lactamase [Acidobacteriaceae bacterium]|nr:subclass B3 metallo-beta-lactamase [Acidobacteriaceae bacterium]